MAVFLTSINIKQKIIKPMMNNGTILTKWISEYCSPVVVTVATAEAETISLKNGLLLHELLSSFSHIDGSFSVRIGNQTFPINDAHVRFERVTELRSKTGEIVEELMRKSFEEYELNRLPSSIPELKASPPSGWSSKIEQLCMRCLSFSEFEMISHPYILLTIVATGDVDHVACLQELSSIHHTPMCFSNGQYDLSLVQRVFVLLDDASQKRSDAATILKQIKTRFPTIPTKLLTINSLPPEAPNVHMADVWSRNLSPSYFPQHAPQLDPNTMKLPLNPLSGTPALGSRLSMEDFMNLRNFCIELFTFDVVPSIERRLTNLRPVFESRKGMKNVFKSFFGSGRKKDEVDVKSTVKYRFDREVAQILLLADTSFMVKDYETALSAYKSIRDDYKSDRAFLHMAHSCLMSAACHLIVEPNKTKDLNSHLETLSQALGSGIELSVAHAYYAMLAAEMFVYNANLRSPLDAARVLLQAASSLKAFPLLCGLLTERAATFFLQANQTRKFVLHYVVAGNRMLKCGLRPSRHSTVCFASCMLILEKGHWGDLKAKLSRILAQDFKQQGREYAQRSLLLMLKMISALLNENNDVGNKSAITDAVNVYSEIIEEGPWGSVCIGEGWENCSTRQILLGSVPIGPMDILNADITKSRSEVVGLSIPEVDKTHAMLLPTLNGPLNPAAIQNSEQIQASQSIAEEMRQLLEIEQQWVNETAGHKVADSNTDNARTLSDRFAEYEETTRSSERSTRAAVGFGSAVRVPLGEQVAVQVKFTNRFPVELKLTKLRLAVEPQQAFQASELEMNMSPESEQQLILIAKPTRCGTYKANAVRWNLSECFGIKQPLHKNGALLQRTLAQRLNRERSADTSMVFEVVPAYPCLKLSFDGLSAEALQGQLLKSALVLRNEGGAVASDIFIKLSQPSFVFCLNQDGEGGGSFLPFYGKTCTIVKLSEEVTILPGQELRLDAWLRITKPGLQTISLLASYKSVREDGSKEFFGPGQRGRTSFLSIHTRGLPSVGATLRAVASPVSTKDHTLLTEIANFLKNTVTEEQRGRLDSRKSSIGQIDIQNSLTSETFIEVGENDVKVMGIWMLGGAEPQPLPQERSARMLLASSLEHVVGCYPIRLLDLMDHGHPASSSTQWLPPFSEMHSPQIQLTTRIVEQFLCVTSANEIFQQELQESRKMLMIAAIEADQAGPRTISQVRRDRQKQEMASTMSVDKLSDTGEDSDWEECDLGEDTITAVVGKGIKQTTRTSSLPVVSPTSAADIAAIEAGRQSITVAIIWVCRWESKIRWGVHYVPHMSFVGMSSPPSAAKSRLSNSSLSLPGAGAKHVAADFLLVGIEYPKRVPFQTSMHHLTVTLKLQSICNDVLCLDIEALKYPLLGGNENAQLNTNPLYIQKMPHVGFNWEGKVKHAEILVEPHTECEVTFGAIVTRPGVYDINRFAITAKTVRNKQHGAPSRKQIVGQCLVEATVENPWEDPIESV